MISPVISPIFLLPGMFSRAYRPSPSILLLAILNLNREDGCIRVLFLFPKEERKVHLAAKTFHGM
jgi:hypothetical protein